jgi:hypothetical protein
MGLLDEAIREHLDLKRRRGADPNEIERLEREALGPVRRAPQEAMESFPEGPVAGAYPAEEDLSDWDEPLEEPTRLDHVSERDDIAATEAWSEPAGEFRHPPVQDYEDEPPPEPGPESPRHHEIAGEWEAHERGELPSEPAGYEPDSPAPAPPAPRPEEDAPAATPPPAPAAGGPLFGEERQRPAPPSEVDRETVEYQVEHEEGEADEPAEGEDVLEETPDFLQDTPDHDRLWFEQRPPRDFDFDG